MTRSNYINAVGGFAGMADPTPKRGGKRSKQKGSRFELEVVNRFQLAGIAAEKMPLSGAVGGSFSGDVTVPVQHQDWRGECKVRATGFRQTYEWLGSHKLLFLKADRQPTLVCMRLEDFIGIIGGKV